MCNSEIPPPPDSEKAELLDDRSVSYTEVMSMSSFEPVEAYFVISNTVNSNIKFHSKHLSNLVDSKIINYNELPISRFTSVELRGSGNISIDPKGLQKKLISDHGVTTWKWNVDANYPRTSFLEYVIYVHSSEAGPPIEAQRIVFQFEVWDGYFGRAIYVLKNLAIALGVISVLTTIIINVRRILPERKKSTWKPITGKIKKKNMPKK
ncbi:MAG: hypothetical protein AAFY41_18375 [Bacteroidota bacterium]